MEWDALREGLDAVFRHEPLTTGKYMDLYTLVYNYCTTLRAMPAHQHSSDVQMIRRAKFADYSFIGYELYNRLTDYITNVTVSIHEKGAELSGEDLLKHFNTEWEDFRLSARVTNCIFSYLSRHWIARELYDGNTSIYMIYTLCMILFREHVFRPLETRLIDAVLEQIRLERRGKPAETLLISGFIACLVEISEEVEETESVYKTSFQERFIKDTSDFYTQAIAQFLRWRGSVTDYMLKMERTFEEENRRLDRYLNSCTREPLIECCEKVLISDQIDFLAFNFGQLLADGQDDDLKRMYRICSRVPNALAHLCAVFMEHLCKEGHDAVERVAKLAINDPKLYVKTLLEVHQKYNQIVERSFNNDLEFLKSLDKATSGFVNVNAVTNLAPPAMQMTKTAELLARYCDQLLRKSSRVLDEEEMDTLQTEALIVFKCVDDKDVFSKLYAKFFSKRLINESSANGEAEAVFINKLTMMCGSEYTNGIVRMVGDMLVSKELSAEFKKMATEQMDVNVMVLTHGWWPSFPMCNLKLPRQLSRTIEEFESFYHGKFNKRRLSWVYSQGRGEVESFAFRKKYVFTVTTAQMCILLLFNEHDSYTGQQISEAIGMDEKTTSAVVDSLTLSHVLKTSDDFEEGEHAFLTATLTLNELYRNKKLQVDLSRNAMNSDVVKEWINTKKSVEEDRRHIVSATIVRILKMRKRIQHPELISEVIAQLSERFTPKAAMIKRSIQELIEKEYLKRDSHQKDFYEYIA